MSTKTNFKRIALVAIASLGLGVLSSVPAKAVIDGVVTLSTTAGTATDGRSDSSTAGTVSVRYLTNTTDTLSLTASLSAKPSGALTPAGLFAFNDSATSINAVTPVPVALTGTDSASVATLTPASGGGWVGSTFKFFMDTNTARSAGTYTYTITATPFPGGVRDAAKVVTSDISITVAALTTASTVASASNSTLFIGASGASADAAVSALATASDTAVGFLNVILRNAANTTAARESVTVTTTIGTVGDGTVRGRSVVLRYNSTSAAYSIFADGTAGTGTITVSTPSVTFATKTVNFYAEAAKTITATVGHPLLKVGTNDGAVRGTAVDANGVAWTGTAYIVASSAADALVAGSTTPVSCGAYDSANARFNCPVTAITSGTAKFKIIDAATVALATATSNEVTVTVNTAAVAKVAISFDKATYAPNERMRIYVTPQDASGASLPANTFTNLLASGGITSNAGFSGSSDTLTAVAFTTSASSSSVTGARAGSAMYTVFAPAAGGAVTITATGGASLPLAGQVAVTGTATVTDSGAAALAAVNALATTVASLRTLITTLTNLVLKIQKKVKA
jgi:hypothetical protein